MLAALALLMGGLAASLWLTRDSWQNLSIKGLTAQLVPQGEGKGKLLLLAQVETLQKEKVELAEKLDELDDQLKRATAKTADLTVELEKPPGSAQKSMSMKCS